MKHLVPLIALCLSACAEGGGYYAPPPPRYAPPPRYMPAPQQYAARPPAAPRRIEMPALHKAPDNVPSAGPLRTAMIGSYMDQQEHDFREHLRGTGVGVVRPADQLVLRLPDAMLFDGHGNLSAAGRNALTTIATIVRHYDHTAIAVTAYVDGSDREARAVAGTLIADGVSARRIASRSGLAVNAGAKTRRVEIRISPQAAA
jgi:outer membrane protein OmpA-like peptidoglycan-associated protein